MTHSVSLTLSLYNNMLLMVMLTMAVAAVVILLVKFVFADGDLAVTSVSHPDGWWKSKVVWVTGASTGIGAAFARHVAELGATVVLSARREKELEEVKASCKVVSPCKEHGVLVLDAADCDSHEAKVAEVIKRFGKIDVLLLNAGRGASELVWNVDLDATRAMLDLNVLGPISLTKQVLPHMRAAGRRCSLAVTSSLGGKIGMPGSASYCMTKFGVNGFFEAARHELADHVDVTIVCPGVVASDFLVNRMVNPSKKDEKSTTSATTGSKPMTSERCAELMALGISNRLPEIWVSTQPNLAFAYVAQYAPGVFRNVVGGMAKKMIANLLEKDKAGK